MRIGSTLDDAPSVAASALDEAGTVLLHPQRGSYPSACSIRRTSPGRLSKAGEAANRHGSDPSHTVLYLAYGSNLSAETFLGRRKIRPLSQVNVLVPTLRLTFDLPGVPYREPCFANVGFRELPGEDSDSSDPQHLPNLSSFDPSPSQPGYIWDGSLMGVVYEVSHEDWRTIMRTEGAGSSYKEIVVPCIPIQAGTAVPGGLPLSGRPQPILARTLHAPHQAEAADESSGKSRWWRRLTTGHRRPRTGCAQASARYLKLLKDGAREHDLPEVYQRYLASLQPYSITHLGQRVGQVVLLSIWAPLLIVFFTLTRSLADESGKLPIWLAGGMAAIFNLLWMSYDSFFKPIFGEGERTVDEAGNQKAMHKRKSSSVVLDEEKFGMLQREVR